MYFNASLNISETKHCCQQVECYVIEIIVCVCVCVGGGGGGGGVSPTFRRERELNLNMLLAWIQFLIYVESGYGALCVMIFIL